MINICFLTCSLTDCLKLWMLKKSARYLLLEIPFEGTTSLYYHVTLSHPLPITVSGPHSLSAESSESFSSGLHPEPQDSDEALALRLQQELDRESADTQTVDLDDGGLFFCQICQKDLSHMTPAGRTQHSNRFGHIYCRCLPNFLTQRGWQ